MSAGHRPCAECRRDRFNLFKEAWIEGNREHAPSGKASVSDIDNLLHLERVDMDSKEKRTYLAQLIDLPSGVFVAVAGKSLLWWEGNAYPWLPTGYQSYVEV